MITEKLLDDHNFNFKDGLFLQNQFSANDFEHTYIEVRKKEGRLLSDTFVSKLPEVDRSNPHFEEWQIRGRSSMRLTDYLNQKLGDKLILEIGCGNGWLTHLLSKIKNAQVVGVDVNVIELKQAANVFKRPNLAFIMGDVFSLNLPVKVNYIVLASSVQYFSDFTKLVNVLSEILSDNGEIHILDTPFYNDDSIADARERSASYFASQNSKMIDHYYHHSWEVLSKFNFQFLYNPGSIVSKLKNKVWADSPFPWIKINKSPHGK
jgi:ubiquinone/menaquinone biosynthesis C-methylase UbiE